MTNAKIISKLHALIEALELVSESDDFCPNKKQWNKICDLIQQLNEEEVATVPTAPLTAPTYSAPVTSSMPAASMPVSSSMPRPNAANPWANGQAASAFPQIPVGDAPVISDSKVSSGKSSLSAPSQSTGGDTGPEFGSGPVGL